MEFSRRIGSMCAAFITSAFALRNEEDTTWVCLSRSVFCVFRQSLNALLEYLGSFRWSPGRCSVGCIWFSTSFQCALGFSGFALVAKSLWTEAEISTFPHFLGSCSSSCLCAKTDMWRAGYCKTYKHRFGIISILGIFHVEYFSCTSCFVFVHALTRVMTFGSANFWETCEIQVLWYFTRAVCRFMQSSEVIVSREADLLCDSWIEEARNLKMSIYFSDPSNTNAFTNNERDASAKATSLAELGSLMGGLLWKLFPNSMYDTVQKVLISHFHSA